MLVLPTGECAEGFHQGVRGRLQRGRGLVFGGRGERFPDGIADVGPGRFGEPAELEVGFAGEAQALAEAADEQLPVSASES